MTMAQYVGKEVEQTMNPIEGLLWMFAILCTLGIAYPAYKMRKNAIHRTSKFYASK
jgi:hypothetical protein